MWSAATAWIDLPPGAGKRDVLAAMRNVLAVHRSHQLVMAAASEAGSNAPTVREQYRQLMDRTIARISRRGV